MQAQAVAERVVRAPAQVREEVEAVTSESRALRAMLAELEAVAAREAAQDSHSPERLVREEPRTQRRRADERWTRAHKQGEDERGMERGGVEPTASRPHRSRGRQRSVRIDE